MATYAIKQGNDEIIVHTFADQRGAFDLSGSSVYWRLFADSDDADADALYTHSWIAGVESGLSLTDPETLTTADPEDGILYNHVTNAITSALTAGWTYYYEIEHVDLNGLVKTLDSGTLTITTAPTLGAVNALGGIPRAELRRQLAERFDDYVPLVATAAGGTLTFVDTYHVNSATDHFNGRDLVFTSGINTGQRRRVTDTSVTGTLSLSLPVLPANTATGDTADAFNAKSRGFTAEQYDRAINNAILAAWPTAAVHLTSDIAASFDASTGEVSIPADFAEIESLEAQDGSGLWYPVPKANHYGGDGWWSDRAAGQLRLYGGRAWGVNAMYLRVFGLGRHPTLDADSDTCSIRPEWIIAHAAYHLAAGAVRNEEHSIRVNIFKDEMERYRVGIVTARGPSSAKVRAA